MSLKPIAALASVLTLHLLATSTCAQTNAFNAEKVIADARAAYYNLTRHGFNGFHATIEPNWKVTLGNAAKPEVLKVFRSQRFSMRVDALGAVTVNREFGEVPSTRVATSVTPIHENVQLLVESFFANWAFFMIGSPFPELRIRIERLDNAYRFFYTVQSTQVRITTTRDFLITETQLSDSKTNRTISPVFQKTGVGFVLLGYHTVFEPMAQGKKTTIDTTIDYQDVGGMKLPSRVHIKGMYGVEPVEAELSFNEHELLSPRRK